MALSPGIPTSFVPKQPVQPVNSRPVKTGTNAFLIIGILIAIIAVVAAVGTFAYGKILDSSLANKQTQLAEAQSKVDENTVEEFVRLRDRLSNGKSLLTNHVLLSQYFDTLEALTLQNVRFDTLKLAVAGDRTATIEMTGVARNFNALAAQSNAFAGEKRIKRAIFSDITVTEDKLVSFSLTADLDPRLIIQGTGLSAAGLQQPLTPGSASTAPALLP